ELVELKSGNDGSFWFLFKYHGLYQYNANKKTIHFQNTENANAVSVSPLKDGSAWLLSDDGTISLLKGGKTVLTRKAFEGFFNSSYEACASFTDSEGDLYVFSTINYKGIYHFNKKKQITERLHTDCKDLRLNTNLVKGITQDENGLLWIATDHGGVNLYDKQKRKVQYLIHKEYDERSIRQNSINSIYTDDNGIVWLGSFKKGLSYYHPNIIKFPHLRHQPSNPHSLPFDDVNTFAEDAKGNLWIGTNGGGLIYFDRVHNVYTTYKHQPVKNSLSNNVVVSLLVDKNQKLWIGTYYGGLDCFDGKKFTNYKKNAANSNSLSDDRVFSLAEDKDGNIWIGTLGGGLNKLNPQTGQFTRFSAADKTIRDDYVSAILERKSGDIWVGTSLGLDIIRKQRKGQAYNNVFSVSTDEYNGLSNANINCITEDANGFVWIGTRNGLNVHNPKANSFIKLFTADGLPDNNIQAIEADKLGNIWVSTSKGLSKVMIAGQHPESYKFKFFNFDELDGLQGLEFNLNSAGITKKGELLFGGPNGFNLFQPQKIIPAAPQFEVQFTDLNILNKTVAVGEVINGEVVLSESITRSKSFTLNHLSNAFSISFAALNYFSPEKVRYYYKLEGFDGDWVAADPKNRKATYTNLDAGKYNFRVQAISGDEVKESNISIVILPPFWKTPLAYLLYTVLVLTSLFLIRQRGINKLKNQLIIEQERKEAQRIHEMDLMKIRFLTNASHEFRTPLSLILAPVEKFIKNTESEEERHQFELIRRNAKRLLNLVNQLMDFRKMEVKELTLNRKKGNIVLFIKDLVDSFTDLAEKKNIRLIFESEID
ncbi:sensor histidine kinase, partial [Pseudoxanthomonas sp. SGD-10]